MKKLKLNRQLGVIALVVFLLSVLLFLILRGKAGEFGVNAIEKIVVNKNGTSITLEKGGSFTFRDKDNVYKDRWEAPKASVFIKYFKENYGPDLEVLYGGRVNSQNVRGFITQGNINGVLVGNASLDAEEFVKICNSSL